MKKVLITVVLLLTVTLLFSQEDYPKKIDIEGKELVLITPTQLTTINSKLSSIKELKDNQQNLKLIISKFEVNTKKLVKINNLLNQKNNKLFIEHSDLIKLNKTNTELIGYYKKEVDIQRRKKVWGTIGGFTIGVTAGATLFLILK